MIWLLGVFVALEISVKTALTSAVTDKVKRIGLGFLIRIEPPI
jgi:hypothetical protein